MAKLLFPFNVLLMLVLIFGTPLAATFGAVNSTTGVLRVLVLLTSPIFFALLMVFIAGGLSLPFHASIRPGKFPRTLDHPTYRRRRYYGICWASLFYCKPIYYLCLTIPWLKWLTFRLFGYRGQMNFTVYPDTWIRDLPLLELGEGAYIANRVTLGTNMPLRDGKVLVDYVRVGRGALIGHLTMLAAGVNIGDGTELGAGCAAGIRVTTGRDCDIGGMCVLGHLAKLNSNIRLGLSSYVGVAAKVDENAVLPAFSSVPDRGVLHARNATRQNGTTPVSESIET